MEEYRKRNFQVMIQSTRQHHIYPYIFSRKLYLVIRPSSFWQEDFSDMYWNLSTKPIKELHTLLCFFVKGFNNKQSRSWIISNSINGETLLVSYNNYVLLWQSHPAPPCPIQKNTFLSPLVWPRRKYSCNILWIFI